MYNAAQRQKIAKQLAARSSERVGHSVATDALLLQTLGTMVHRRSRGAVSLSRTATVAYEHAGWSREMRRGAVGAVKVSEGGMKVRKNGVLSFRWRRG